MNVEQIIDLLKSIRGCTFASLDAETIVKGFRHVKTGERVIVFTNKKSSGYENMVKRRLLGAGLNPDSFVLGDLPWGQRVPDTPLITHKGEYYLQTIFLGAWTSKYYLGSQEVPEHLLGGIITRPRHYEQGLPKEKEVTVKTYKLSSITGIRLMRETLSIKGD